MLFDMPPPTSTLFLILLGVWSLAYVTGMIAGTTNAERTRRLPRWAKLLMIGLTLALGVIAWLALARGTGAEPYARWIVIGLAFGACGDLILGGFLPVKHPTIPGIIVFAIGHVFYLLAIFTMRVWLLPGGWFPAAVILVPSLFAAALLWEFLVHNPAGDRAVNTGSFFYALLLVATTAFALYFPVRARVMYSLGIGMALFAVSDLMLAQALVRERPFPYVHDVVWIVYSAGQVLIALSIGEAIRFF